MTGSLGTCQLLSVLSQGPGAAGAACAAAQALGNTKYQDIYIEHSCYLLYSQLLYIKKRFIYGPHNRSFNECNQLDHQLGWTEPLHL